jgi:hypothetical protein
MTLPTRASQVSALKWRLAVGAVGVLGIAYGAKLLFGNQHVNRPWEVIKWAIGADIVTDGLLIPAAILVGWLITRVVRPRARRYVQGALVAGASVTVVALPLIYRRGDAQPGQGLLLQNYTENLAILLGIVAAAAIGVYVVRLVRDQAAQRPSIAKVRPPDDQDSSSA